ncbi:MAG: acetyl-CoA C-acyltransferase [Candidatus Yanofskybacteria bacterium]|nr:acetyl-CoA C-acyltransferase [Candidatus Yanofskybacteria bacterium]
MVIIDGVRTAIGSFGGSLKDVPADILLAICYSEILKRTGIDPNIISEVVAGNISHPVPNIARISAQLAGVPNHVPARTVSRNCWSGAEAITSACQSHAAGDGNVFLVGGTENMSRIPYILKGTRFGEKMQHGILVDALWEGLVDPIIDQIMGRTAENVAKKWDVSRKDQDEFAVKSHQKAKHAKTEGKFKSQIVPVVIKKTTSVGNKTMGGEIIFAEDECVNPDPNDAKWIQRLSMLPAIFMNEHISDPKKSKAVFRDGKAVMHESYTDEGSITPGNSCPISDGAAALLIMSEEKAKELGLNPMAYIVSYACTGCDNAYMGEGPMYAVPKALDKARLRIEDIDIFELNEAFAAQSLACQRKLNIADDKLNVWGGAIALGHPVGATGSALAVKAMNILQETNKRYAAITMCIGGGQGGCLIIERGQAENTLSKTRAIRKVAIIGGGAMGRGIAMLVSQKGTPVVIKEINSELAKKSLQAVHSKLDEAAKRGKLTASSDIIKRLITATDSLVDIQDADLVIEAVFEKMEIKRKIFDELDKIVKPDAIFATNTSSLSISEMASVTKRGDKFVGMHFFNPPVTMPLVEMISGRETSEETRIAVETFSKDSLGKVVIRVKECPAFLVNRLLMPYLNEATFLLTETNLTVQEIDDIASKFGWPMGPFQLLDYIGIDVAAEVAEICHQGYGERATPAPLMHRLVELGRLGQKTGVGFYSREHEPLASIIDREFPEREPSFVNDGFRRMMLGMANEAFLCLEENISSADEIETGCLYGIGFPMALEGPLHWAENEGLDTILAELRGLEKNYGIRFKPSKLLEKYVAEGTRIFEGW